MMKMLPSTFRRTLLTPRPSTIRSTLATRHFQTSPQRCLPKKNAMDKDTIDTDSNEYSKSGGDSASAQAADKAAFDPKSTSPEEEHEIARQETGGNSNNPLNVSPANQEVSKTMKANRGGAEGSPDESGQGSERSRTSGGGSPAKSGGGKSGGGPL